MHDILDIKKRQYIDILANRGIGIKNNPSLGALQTKVSYLKKRDLIHLAKLGSLVVDEKDLVNIIQVLLKSVLGPKLKDDLYREMEKRKYKKIINKVKRLKRLKNIPLDNKENISEKELQKLTPLPKLPTQSLKKIAQLRGVETTGLKRHELFTISMRTEKHHRKKKYLQDLQSDLVSEIDTLINLIRIDIIKLDRLLDKSDRNKIRKRLYEIDNVKRTHKRNKILIDELKNISNSLRYIKEHSGFDSSGYYGLKDLEYMFNDIDNYYFLY